MFPYIIKNMHSRTRMRTRTQVLFGLLDEVDHLAMIERCVKPINQVHIHAHTHTHMHRTELQNAGLVLRLHLPRIRLAFSLLHTNTQHLVKTAMANGLSESLFEKTTDDEYALKWPGACRIELAIPVPRMTVMVLVSQYEHHMLVP